MQSSVESGEEVGEVRDWQMIELGRAILEGKKILENRVNGLPDDYGFPCFLTAFVPYSTFMIRMRWSLSAV